MKPCENSICDICPGDGTVSHEGTKIVSNKPAPLYLEMNGQKKQVGTAEPVLDSDGHLVGISANITDPDLQGFTQRKPNPLCRIEPFSIGVSEDWRLG